MGQGERVPVEGWPAGLKFDGRLIYMWWGQDLAEQDCVATRDGRPITFTSEAECLAAVRAAGWVEAGAGEPEDDTPASVQDLEPAQEWLRGKRMALDPVSGLDLWNWGTDIAYSVGRPWSYRGPIRDRCYDKLFVANVPWVAGMKSYRPIWTPRQLRALREGLGQAVHILRTGLPA